MCGSRARRRFDSHGTESVWPGQEVAASRTPAESKGSRHVSTAFLHAFAGFSAPACLGEGLRGWGKGRVATFHKRAAASSTKSTLWVVARPIQSNCDASSCIATSHACCPKAPVPCAQQSLNQDPAHLDAGVKYTFQTMIQHIHTAAHHQHAWHKR